jgi:predicted DCC family thiol-disulfide oxidoreductase YuxK
MHISLSTEMSDGRRKQARGWVLYDETCELCRKSVVFWHGVIARRGFAFAALQEPWVRERLRMSDVELLREMRLLLRDGRVFGGADAILQLARAIWWAWPLVAMARVPGVNRLLRAAYRAVAARRSCANGACDLSADGSKRPA